MSEAHWESLKAVRAVIAPERFARLRSDGFTKQTDLAVVQAAIDSWYEARNQYVAAYRASSEAIDSLVGPEDRKYPGWLKYATAEVQAIHAAMQEANEKTSPGLSPRSRTHYYGEDFPLSRWAKEESCFRRWADKMRKVVSKSLATVAV